MLSATPLFDDSGQAVRGGIAALLDITERRAESHQQVLLYELQHRVKNILATIGALASRMMKDSDSLEDFSGASLAAFQAMARTHELLSARQLDGRGPARPDRRPRSSASPEDSTRVDLRGPDPDLNAGRRLDAGPGVLRIATNATKYGSLSAERAASG